MSVIPIILKKKKLGSKLKQNEPEVTAYIAGLTTPLSAGQVTKLNTFVRALKTGLGITALSEVFDVMYILANETAESGLRNLVKNAHHAEAVNAPTFTALEGFTGNGTSSYIETYWNGRSAGHAVRYALNSASFGVYHRDNVVISTQKIHGAYSTVEDGGLNNRIYITKVSGSGDDWLQYNGSTLNATIAIIGEEANTAQSGLFIANKINSSSTTLFINKNVERIVQENSTKIPNQSVLLLARKDANGYAGRFIPEQISFAFLGRGLSVEEVNTITDVFNDYMENIVGTILQEETVLNDNTII